MHLKKALGQHLLVSEPTLEKIARTLAPTKKDTVLEIGPGTGKLTKHLATLAGHVIAIEKDADMVERLKGTLKGIDNVTVIHADFLELDLTKTLKYLNTKTLFCGNLPYNISSQILFKLKDARALFSRGVFMVQKEVAERLYSKPGSKDYGILSILLQASAEIKKCFYVSPGAFLPPPKVTSTVVRASFYDNDPYKISDEELFARIVKKAFGQRRKMIRNTLGRDYLTYLEKAGIDPSSRAEDLPLEKFALLTSVVKKGA